MVRLIARPRARFKAVAARRGEAKPEWVTAAFDADWTADQMIAECARRDLNFSVDRMRYGNTKVWCIQVTVRDVDPVKMVRTVHTADLYPSHRVDTRQLGMYETTVLRNAVSGDAGLTWLGPDYLVTGIKRDKPLRYISSRSKEAETALIMMLPFPVAGRQRRSR